MELQRRNGKLLRNEVGVSHFVSGISEIGVTRYSHRATITLLRTISSDHEHIMSNLKCSMKFDVTCICEMCKC